MPHGVFLGSAKGEITQRLRLVILVFYDFAFRYLGMLIFTVYKEVQQGLICVRTFYDCAFAFM
jgi:hypothetical protein